MSSSKWTKDSGGEETSCTSLNRRDFPVLVSCRAGCCTDATHRQQEKDTAQHKPLSLQRSCLFRGVDESPGLHQYPTPQTCMQADTNGSFRIQVCLSILPRYTHTERHVRGCPTQRRTESREYAGDLRDLLPGSQPGTNSVDIVSLKKSSRKESFHNADLGCRAGDQLCGARCIAVERHTLHIHRRTIKHGQAWKSSSNDPS